MNILDNYPAINEHHKNVEVAHPSLSGFPLMASVKELDVLLELFVFGALHFGFAVFHGSTHDLCGLGGLLDLDLGLGLGLLGRAVLLGICAVE